MRASCLQAEEGCDEHSNEDDVDGQPHQDQARRQRLHLYVPKGREEQHDGDAHKILYTAQGEPGRTQAKPRCFSALLVLREDSTSQQSTGVASSLENGSLLGAVCKASGVLASMPWGCKVWEGAQYLVEHEADLGLPLVPG